MKKVNIIYWSGTGNTETMAQAIEKGAKSKSEEVKLINVEDASISDITSADVVILGCPSMGDEQLEESIMQPFVESLEDSISEKEVALFGSYGWGDGEWMRNWVETMKNYGAKLLNEGLIHQGEPDDDCLNQCIELGETIA